MKIRDDENRGRESSPTEVNWDSRKLLIPHVLLLTAGTTIGMCLAYLLQSLPIPYGWSLEKARSLGIVSSTILDGYPKERDVIGYAILAISTVFCGLAVWWMWARKRREELAWLIMSEQEGQRSSLRMALLAAIAISVPLFLYTNSSTFIGPVDSWTFFGEEGMILSAVNEILNGRIQGRDYFGLYGPMMTYPLAWLMMLFGRSLLIARYYAFALHILSYLAAAFILHRIVRQTSVAALFLLVFITVFPVAIIPHSSYLRFTLGILPVLLYTTGRSFASTVFAGLLVGQSLLFSQEAGLCSVIALTFAWSFRDQRTFHRKALHGLALVISCGVSLTPFFLFAAAKGGLGAFLLTLIEYPGLVGLGYGGLPFPGLDAWMSVPASQMLFCYWSVSVYIITLLYSVPLMILGSRSHCHIYATAIALYGLLLFRIALGRSDFSHILNAAPPALLLVPLLAESFWDRVSGTSLIPVNKPARFGLGSTFFLLAAFLVSPLINYDLNTIWSRLSSAISEARPVPRGIEAPSIPALKGTRLSWEDHHFVSATHDFLKKNLRQSEYVYFFPNEPMLYFLFELPSPTRFHMAYQAVTTAQRKEIVNDLESRKPKYLVYNYITLRIDDIPEQVQVPEVLTYLQAHYALCLQSDAVAIFARAGTICSRASDSGATNSRQQ